jgi:S-formylglutathione hydrolase FrmB
VSRFDACHSWSRSSSLPRTLALTAFGIVGLLATIWGLVAPAAASNSGSVPMPARPTIDAEPTLNPPLRLVSQQKLTPELSQLTLQTTILSPTETTVRVLLPMGYAISTRRYPVIYLLHGGLEDSSAWTTVGNVEQVTAGKPVIVVMPSEGQFGYYTNWFNKGAFGPPLWETYNVDQLIPYVDRTYRTIAKRSGRAVAGLSLGGAGATSLAARHPDLFGAVGSFSGAVDITTPANRETLDPVASLIFGTWEAEQVRWRGSNGSDLAANLRNTDLSFYSGQGTSAPAGLANLEKMIHEDNVSMNARLNHFRIAHAWDNYAGGVHDWTYFNQDFANWFPHVMNYFAQKHSLPASFTQSSINPAYSVYGWNVSVHRPALEFSALEVANASSFKVIGSGSATVETAPVYHSGKMYSVVVSSSTGERTSYSVAASESGRLKIDVPLGPGNPHQQYTPASEQRRGSTPAGAIAHAPFLIIGNGSHFYESTVSITA